MTLGHACGKVILLGEHAVVHGIPALAVGIDQGARATATPMPEGPSRLFVRGWDIVVRETDEGHDLARAFRALLNVAQPPLGPRWIEVETDLPPGGGLGCSAAIGVAVARALEPDLTAEALQDRAMAWECVFHGNPSGVDSAVAARGGCILFRRGQPLESVHVRGPMHLCVGNTGCASSTKTMVEAVARLRSRRPEIVEKSFEAIRTLVSNARLAIEAGDWYALGKLLDLNQMLLGGLFVSTPEIERMCGIAREAGALGAKLTGAGGGGSVVALASSRAAADAVIQAWKKDGFSGFATCVAAEPRARPVEQGAVP